MADGGFGIAGPAVLKLKSGIEADGWDTGSTDAVDVKGEPDGAFRDT